MDPLELLAQLLHPSLSQPGGTVTVPMPPPPPAPVGSLPTPPAAPPGVQPLAAPPPMMGPQRSWLDSVRSKNPYPVPAESNLPSMGLAQPTMPNPAPMAAVEPAPNFPSNLAQGPSETGSLDPMELISQMVGLPQEPPPVGSQPSRQGGYGAGPSVAPGGGGGGGPSATPAKAGGPMAAAPAAAPVAAGPVTAPEPVPAEPNRPGSSALSDPQGRTNLSQLLTIMGAVLMQPIPPGGNAMSQIGKALTTGVLYQDSVLRSGQEQDNKRMELEQAGRRVAVQEKALGIDARRADTAQYGAETDRAGTIARIRNLDASLPGILAGADLARAQADLARIHAMGEPEKQRLALEEFERRNRLTDVQIDTARANLGTPGQRGAAKMTELLQKAGAFGDGMGGPPNLDAGYQIFAINGAANGYQPMNAQQAAAGQAAYDKLIKEGRTPAQANEVLFSFAMQRNLQPRRFGQPGAR